jgi:hypothetical protein
MKLTVCESARGASMKGFATFKAVRSIASHRSETLKTFVDVGDGLGVGEGFEVTGIFGCFLASLLHSNFPPLFVQVYLVPLTVLLTPALRQGAPGLGEGAANAIVELQTSRVSKNAIFSK